jgi:hypothetical protein
LTATKSLIGTGRHFFNNIQKQGQALQSQALRPSLAGNVRVFVRVRPQFEDEGLMSCSFPDENTVRVSAANVGGSAVPKRDFELDRVFGPHVDQAELFEEIQPIVQSVFDGYNACVLAYGQTGAGKTYTMVWLPVSYSASARRRLLW